MPFENLKGTCDWHLCSQSPMVLDLPPDDDGPIIDMDWKSLSMAPDVDLGDSMTPARKTQRLPSLECPNWMK